MPSPPPPSRDVDPGPPSNPNPGGGGEGGGGSGGEGGGDGDGDSGSGGISDQSPSLPVDKSESIPMEILRNPDTDLTAIKSSGLLFWLVVILSIPGDSAVPNNHALDVSKADVTQGKSQAPQTGEPNSDYEQVDDNGNVRSHTHYDENGNKDYREDFDHTHSGEQPHRHDYLIDPKTGYKIDEDP